MRNCTAVSSWSSLPPINASFHCPDSWVHYRQRGVYRGRTKALSAGQVTELHRRVSAGEAKAQIAREFGISRETLYQYLRHG